MDMEQDGFGLAEAVLANDLDAMRKALAGGADPNMEVSWGSGEKMSISALAAMLNWEAAKVLGEAGAVWVGDSKLALAVGRMLDGGAAARALAEAVAEQEKMLAAKAQRDEIAEATGKALSKGMQSGCKGL